jgi:hypothetical protein
LFEFSHGLDPEQTLGSQARRLFANSRVDVAQVQRLHLITDLSGMPEGKRRTRSIVVFQAYIDDSADSHVLVLAGYIAPFDAWMAFTEEWKEQIDNFGGKPFKMSQMAQSEEGLRQTEIFYRIIERHVTAAISCAVYKDDLIKIIEEVPRPAPILDIDILKNAYYPAFTGIMTTFTHTQESIGIDEAVDFIFDDQNEKANLLNTWDLLKAGADPNVRRFLGANPRFENDEDFLQLQAADLFRLVGA